MPNLKLTLACWDYDRTRPLMDGRVKPEGIDLDIKVLRPREAFQRMLDNKEFQVSELSLASYTALKGRGECPFVAVPVALSKIFRHSCIYVRTGAGIKKPQDLKGKRVGTSQYSSTGLVFMRGMLQHDYGVKSQDMHWFMGGSTRSSSRRSLRSICPRRSDLNSSRPARRWKRCSRTDNSTRCCRSTFQNCFLPARRVSLGCFRTTRRWSRIITGARKIFPIMHTVVVREDVHRAHPWVAKSIYRAFCEARALAIDGLYDTDALRVALPWLIDHVEETWRVFGKNFWAYGLEPNRPTFEAIGRYVYEQGLSPRIVSADELFLPGVE